MVVNIKEGTLNRKVFSLSLLEVSHKADFIVTLHYDLYSAYISKPFTDKSYNLKLPNLK